MVTPTFLKINFLQIKSEFRRSSGDAREKCGSTTGLAWIGNTMSPRDVVEAPLNPDNIRLGFSRFKGVYPICFITDTCKRFAELPGSTKIHLTSKSLIPNVRIRASRCGCNIWLGSIEGKVITPSIEQVIPLVNLGWM